MNQQPDLKSLDLYRPLKVTEDLFKENQTYRLDTFLAKHFGFLSRNKWRDKINKGYVLVEKKPVKPSLTINKNDNIYYYQTPMEEPPVNRNIPILYQDQDLLIINKPHNLPIHPSGVYFRNTLTSILEEKQLDYDPVHRLDRETSGIIICAQSSQVKEKMRKMFENQPIDKEYLAITYGEIPHKEFTITQPLLLDPDHPKRKKMKVDPNGYESITQIKVLEHKGPYSLLQVFPKTGRTNQIRAHFEYNNTPILGDSLYCIYNNTPLQKTSSRLALHAHKISFTHPVKLERLTIQAKFPDSLKQLWTTLGSVKTTPN